MKRELVVILEHAPKVDATLPFLASDGEQLALARVAEVKVAGVGFQVTLRFSEEEWPRVSAAISAKTAQRYSIGIRGEEAEQERKAK